MEGLTDRQTNYHVLFQKALPIVSGLKFKFYTILVLKEKKVYFLKQITRLFAKLATEILNIKYIPKIINFKTLEYQFKICLRYVYIHKCNKFNIRYH